MWLPLHAIKKVHKVNDNITSTRHVNLPEHVPIQKWDIQWSQLIINHPRVPQYILQQGKNHICFICRGMNWHHQQNQSENSRSNWTSPRRLVGGILFHIDSHWKTAPHIHMDRYTSELTGNRKGRWPCYGGKPSRYDQGIPYFLMESTNSNHEPSQQWTRKRGSIIS